MTRRRLWGGLAGVAGLMVLMVLTVNILIARSDLAYQIQENIKNATGADLVVGSATVQWWGGLALVLRDGSIDGQGAQLMERQGFGADLDHYHLNFSKIALALNWPALWHGEVELRKLHVMGSELAIEISADSFTAKNFAIDLTNLTWPNDGPITADQIAFDLQWECAEYTGQGTEWSEVEMAGQWQDSQLKLPQVAAGLGAGQVTAAIVVAWDNEGPGVISGTATLEDVPSGLLLAPFLPS